MPLYAASPSKPFFAELVRVDSGELERVIVGMV